MWKRICLGLVLAAECLLTGCIPGLPESAWQAAVTAVCSSPAVSGQSLCQQVKYIGFAEIAQEEALFPNLKRTHEYCVVLGYVDFTGEAGTAWVLVSGPTESGEYQTDGGPLFNQACTQ